MQKKYQQLVEKKRNKIPFSMVTAYDYPTARIEQEAGIDVILVGDSVGTNVLGYASEQEVTMGDMIHHLKAVVRGAPESLIMVDLPFGTASEPEKALKNARQLIDAGADIVKIEGWEHKKEVVGYLTAHGVSVCGHIGYNPQYHGPKGRVFGKEFAAAVELIRSARALEKAGAVMLIVEKIPEEVCGMITSLLSIPVVGIGSGRYCDAQVLVVHDIIGLVWRTFRHARAYGSVREITAAAIQSYKQEVENGSFPAEEHVSHLDPDIVEQITLFLNRE